MVKMDKEEYKTLNKKDFDKYKHDNRFIHEVTFSHGVERWKEYKKAMTKYTIAKQDYKVTKDFIKKAKRIYQYRKKKVIKSITKNKLVFVGMGMSFNPSTINHLNNHRIRTYFKNNEGVLCFVEFGTSLNKDFLRCDHALTNTKKNNSEWDSLRQREETEKRINELESIKGDYTPYTKESILNLVNKYFNCSFNEVEIQDYFISTSDYICKSGGVLK